MDVYYIIYLGIQLACCIIGCINYNRSAKPMRFLIVLLGYTFISEIVAYWAAVVYRNNLPVAHVYNFISVGIYSGFFYETIANEKWRRVVLYSGAVLMLLCIVNVIWFDPILTYPANIFKLKTLFLFACACILLLQQLDLPSGKRLFRDPAFLAALSLVWFNTISSLFYFLNPMLSRHKIKSDFIGDLHYYSNLVHYLIFLLAMIYLKNYRDNVRIRYN